MIDAQTQNAVNINVQVLLIKSEYPEKLGLFQ